MSEPVLKELVKLGFRTLSETQKWYQVSTASPEIYALVPKGLSGTSCELQVLKWLWLVCPWHVLQSAVCAVYSITETQNPKPFLKPWKPQNVSLWMLVAHA